MGLGGGWPFGRGGNRRRRRARDALLCGGNRNEGRWPPVRWSSSPHIREAIATESGNHHLNESPHAGGGEGASEPVAYVSRWAASRMVHA